MPQAQAGIVNIPPVFVQNGENQASAEKKNSFGRTGCRSGKRRKFNKPNSSNYFISFLIDFIAYLYYNIM